MVAAGAAPGILNASNEIAVAAFLDRQIAFGDISGVVARVLDRYGPTAPTSLQDVLAIDAEARRLTLVILESVAA